MRMWYGKEKEGECDDITLFVQTHFLSDERVLQVRKSANDYNVSRIYLGAGRTDLEGITGDALDILRIMSSSFKIVVETTAAFVDIAEELGVSTATVSNVINGTTKKISDKTIERVQKKLEEKKNK